jgi:hypothetical protein
VDGRLFIVDLAVFVLLLQYGAAHILLKTAKSVGWPDAISTE